MNDQQEVSAPKSYSFKDVNHWVHIDAPHYEHLQANLLGIATRIEELEKRTAYQSRLLNECKGHLRGFKMSMLLRTRENLIDEIEDAEKKDLE